MKKKLTLGQKAADLVAMGVGSWGFLIGFNVCLALWIIFNSNVAKPFDPYPFILLNLGLSWLAGVQAPIIMISQNRQEEIQRKQLKYMLSLMEAVRAHIISTQEDTKEIETLIGEKK